jgi:cytochrome P450
MKSSDPTLTDAVIQAHVFGMVIGLVPTNLIAGGNMLDTLLRFPAFMERTRAAALAGDDDLLWRCLQEALRFQHVNPGTWRKCTDRAQTIAAGTAREKTIPAGATLLVSVQSAMFDPRCIERPKKFNPDRRSEDYLVFGYGQHWCIGAYIAMAQITQTFKALLKKKHLRRAKGAAGRLQRIGAYPMHLTLEFDA